MASNKILSENKIQTFFHEPGGTSAENVSFVSQRDFNCFGVGYTRCVGTAALTALSIVVGDAASPSTTAIVKSKDVTSNPDAVGDQVYFEASAEEILDAATTAGISGVELFVTAQVTEADAGNDSAIVYIQSNGHGKDGLTADSIA